MPIKTLLCWILIHVIVSTKFECERSCVIGSDLHCYVNCLPRCVRFYDCSGCKLSSRCFMITGIFKPTITTNSTPSISCIKLIGKASTKSFVIIIIVGCIKSVPPSCCPRGWVCQPSMTRYKYSLKEGYYLNKLGGIVF